MASIGTFKDGTFDYTPIEEAEAHRIDAAMGAIQRFAYRQRFFFIVSSNHAELLAGLEHCAAAFAQMGSLNQTVGAEMLIDINRRLLNLLSAFRSFIDFSRHLLSDRFGADSTQCEEFTRACSTEYDRSEYYRIAYHLRNYAQHYGPPIDDVHAQSNLVNGKPVHRIDFVMLRSQLLNSGYEWNAQMRADLEQGDDVMDLVALANDLKLSLERLAVLRLRLEQDEALLAMNTLIPYIERLEPQGHPLLFMREPYPGSDNQMIFEARWFPMEAVKQFQKALTDVEQTT